MGPAGFADAGTRSAGTRAAPQVISKARSLCRLGKTADAAPLETQLLCSRWSSTAIGDWKLWNRMDGRRFPFDISPKCPRADSSNLLDLAQASGLELPRTRELKDRRRFVPLHAHLRDGDYDRFFEILREAGQL